MTTPYFAQDIRLRRLTLGAPKTRRNGTQRLMNPLLSGPSIVSACHNAISNQAIFGHREGAPCRY